MVVMLLHEDLIKMYIEKDTLERLEKSSKVRRIIFNMLTVGTNVMNTESYNDVAAWLLTVPEEKLKEVTMKDVVSGAGNYIDESGYLV